MKNCQREFRIVPDVSETLVRLQSRSMVRWLAQLKSYR